MRPKRNKLRGGFKIGDLVTGKDRSYKRSIYKIIGSTSDPKFLLLEFVTLGEDTFESHVDSGAVMTVLRSGRKYTDFRKATRKEIKESNRVRATYLLRRLLINLDISSANDYIFY